ncbi:MAG: MFS transporter [Chloroflexota bacterium]
MATLRFPAAAIMVNRFFASRHQYSPQFWLILGGLLIGTIGSSMVFPFLTIYVSEKLALPLTDVASLITLNGFIGLAASFVAGPITDRFGRKWVMVLSLIGNGVTYYLFRQAETYLFFATLMAMRGLFHPMYKVGTSAMVTDLVTPEQRVDAFALMRTADNLGIAIGPAIGGFVAATSYNASFTTASMTLLIFGLSIALFAQETVPREAPDIMGPEAKKRPSAGYGEVIKDRQFLAFVFSFTLFKICSVMLWALLAVYAKQNYGLPENQYGFIPTTNALMVVLFQVLATRITRRYLPLPVMAVGTLVYALGVTSIAAGQGFWGFWLSFVVVTIGELMIMPTSTTFVANLAPIDKRGRYMSFFSLSQGAGRGIAPLLGGLLNDHIGPKAIWYGGGLIGLASAACYAVMGVYYAPRKAAAREANITR